MFYYIKGIVQEFNEGFVIVEANGIGYQIFISSDTLAKLKINEEAKLLIYNNIREDEWVLYGFLSEKEKHLFENLKTVKSIGAKSAMTILSSISAEALVRAIINEDIKTLSRVKSIGKKTAERILVELKTKLTKEEEFLVSLGVNQNVQNTNGGNVDPNVLNDAIEGLMSLGFAYQDAKSAVDKASKFTTKTDELIRLALKSMN